MSILWITLKPLFKEDRFEELLCFCEIFLDLCLKIFVWCCLQIHMSPHLIFNDFFIDFPFNQILCGGQYVLIEDFQFTLFFHATQGCSYSDTAKKAGTHSVFIGLLNYLMILRHIYIFGKAADKSEKILFENH